MSKLGNTDLMTRQQIVARCKEIVQAALDERDKAIDEAQGMLMVVAAIVVKSGGEIIVTDADLREAPRHLAFETDVDGTRRICLFEMREKEGDMQEQKRLTPPPEQTLLTATTGEAAAASRLTPTGAKIELMK